MACFTASPGRVRELQQVMNMTTTTVSEDIMESTSFMTSSATDEEDSCIDEDFFDFGEVSNACAFCV
eukprot:CAMPEP_0197033506 /NCGR_PEP_ID=MMETSP1384-20130603/11897_1 /TAXON_ID=29189 /ORGANISM="Ammonia sp." /LENGTH=66 /DNA_ID=CAMNT_0042463321 /DNA_START=114 /DNA_END=310 /DNA_ORIENTATION=+